MLNLLKIELLILIKQKLIINQVYISAKLNFKNISTNKAIYLLKLFIAF